MCNLNFVERRKGEVFLGLLKWSLEDMRSQARLLVQGVDNRENYPVVKMMLTQLRSEYADAGGFN